MEIQEGYQNEAKVILVLTSGRPDVLELNEVLESVLMALNHGWIVFALGAIAGCLGIFSIVIMVYHLCYILWMEHFGLSCFRLRTQILQTRKFAQLGTLILMLMTGLGDEGIKTLVCIKRNEACCPFQQKQCKIYVFSGKLVWWVRYPNRYVGSWAGCGLYDREAFGMILASRDDFGGWNVRQNIPETSSVEYSVD